LQASVEAQRMIHRLRQAVGLEISQALSLLLGAAGQQAHPAGPPGARYRS
jgi:hypothetical protein